jgi:tetratricopeptide (TPR) repeat protein
MVVGDHNAMVRSLLARAHRLMCQLKYDEAYPLVRRAVHLAPASLEAWRELGGVCGSLGLVEEMEHAFEQALQLAATTVDELLTWFSRGNAENNADAWDLALRSFARMAELEPDCGTPWLFRGMVLSNMGLVLDPRYHEEALVALDRALESDDLSPIDERVAYTLKAKALTGLGRREEAAAYERRAGEMWDAEMAAKRAAPPGHAGSSRSSRAAQRARRSRRGTRRAHQRR